MQITEFKEDDIDAVFETQQAAYRPLYEKNIVTIIRAHIRKARKRFCKHTKIYAGGHARLSFYSERGAGRGGERACRY